MKKTLISLAVMAALVVVAGVGIAQADTRTGSVSITTVIASIEISVSPVDWAIGAIDYIATPISTGISGKFAVTNSNVNSNTAVDLTIQGANSTTGVKKWTIGTSGAGTFLLECQGGVLECATWASIAAPKTLATSVAKGGTATFDLRLTLPTDAASTDEAQAIAATVTAAIAA